METNSSIAVLSSIDPGFRHYLANRKSQHQKHITGNGLPDYAYPADLEYRKNLDSIPGFFNFVHKMAISSAARMKQYGNLNWLAVSPTQFPEIYQITCDCARRLGISIPQVFVDNSELVNAYTIAVDDVEPVIILGNMLVKRFTLNEIRVVIGHECGHIHNMHSVYDYFVRMVLKGGAETAGSILTSMKGLLTAGALLTLNRWSRAAEVTADRAGLICCEEPEDAYRVNQKLLYGGVELGNKITTDISIDELHQQLHSLEQSGGKYYELLFDHPSGIKRIFAEMEFTQCELFYNWRPDLREPGMNLHSKEETDNRCRNMIDIVGKGQP